MLTFKTFEESYHKLLQYFSSSDFKDEVTSAKIFFFENTGTLDETNPNFNLRMNQFYDWYFLTRPLDGFRRRPVSVAETLRDLRLTQEDLETIDSLKNHKHSIFEFIKEKNNQILILDLFKNEKIFLEKEDMFFSFEEKQYFEARFVKIDGKNYFLKGFCFHPEAAQKFILNQIKEFKKNPDLVFSEFLLRINKMRYKLEQYRHLKPIDIYKIDNRLGL